MNKDEAIKIVESGQKWAKGDDSQPQPNMIEVYEAIELLLAEVKNNSRLVNVSGGLLQESSDILKGYEQFEADIIADDAMWSPDAISGKHYDSMMNLQERRNDFFAKFNNR
jgi:hypothetical protein